MSTSKAIGLMMPLALALGLAGCASEERLSVEEGGAVEIADFAFAPGDVQVRAGEPVTWLNRDAFHHTVAAADGSFGSGTLDQGGRFMRTFDTPGEFAYRCEIHSQMRGTVRVVE